MFTKRALSDIVTTVLIILLVLAAIGIVWSFVLPLIQRAGEEVNADCFTISLTAQECTYISNVSGEFAQIRIQRGTGEGDLQDIKLIFSDGEEVLDAGTTLNILQSITRTYQLSEGQPTNLNVAPVVGENLKVCNPSPSPVLCN